MPKVGEIKNDNEKIGQISNRPKIGQITNVVNKPKLM